MLMCDFLGIKIRQIKLNDATIVLGYYVSLVGANWVAVLINQLSLHPFGIGISDFGDDCFGVSIYHADVKIGDFFDVG